MILGTYDNKTGVYTFNGRPYIPKWSANTTTEPDVLKIYNTCIEGYDSLPMCGWPKAVILTYNLPGRLKWNEIKAHYPGLYAQSQLHCYHPAPVGVIPDWAIPWKQEAHLLIHEYEDGKVAWMRDDDKFDNDIYIFMDDYELPQSGSTTITTDDETQYWQVLPKTTHITGKFNIWNGEFNITKVEE